MKTNTAESIAIYAEDAVRARMRNRWEERREETDQPPKLYLGSQERSGEMGDHYFSAAWRGRFPLTNERVTNWTPFSLRNLTVRP